MPTLAIGGRPIELDDDGYLADPSQWDRAVAEALAQIEGIEEMTDDHWKVVNYLRDYFLRFGLAPMVRKLTKDTQLELRIINQLFASGPAKGACKVAGLPRPTGCL